MIPNRRWQDRRHRYDAAMRIPYPDVSGFAEDLAAAVCRMVRLVNHMHERHPELDRFALSAETEIDRIAAEVVVKHVATLDVGFEMFLSPYDPGALPHNGPPPVNRPRNVR